MNKTLKKVAILGSIFILFLFIVFVINQTAQVVDLADKVNPRFGNIVFWLLVTVYAFLILIPVTMVLRLPPSLSPPSSREGPEFDIYLKALRKRLASNPHLKGMDLSNQQQIEKALALLANKANEIIHQTSATVFLSTAISQSGRLDAFVVLSAQSRMVWRIARLYYQRPLFRDLTHLYANVAGTVFFANELQDLDLGEQVKPVLSSALGAMAVTLPGFQLAASILVNSVLAGAANAFLTLRVGIIARRYCGSLVISEKRTLRRASSAEAAKLLGSIVKQGTAGLSKALWEVSKDKVETAVSGMKGYVKETSNSFLARVGLRKSGESLFAEIEAITPMSENLSPGEEEETDPGHHFRTKGG